MTILATAPGQYSGDTLKTGEYYQVQSAESGTERQNFRK